MEELFPFKKDVIYTKLQITEEGKYSITRRKDSQRIFSIINSIVKDVPTKTITDATACVGGDTIMFAMNFRFVDSIEINKDNFEALVNNLGEYQIKNVSIHHGNSVNVFTWKTDVLYIDPPWGGRNYKEHKDLDLYLGDTRLDLWVEKILIGKNRPSYIFLKLPFNYNFKRFNILSNINMIKSYRVRSYVLIAMYVHMPNRVQSL